MQQAGELIRKAINANDDPLGIMPTDEILQASGLGVGFPVDNYPTPIYA